MIFKLFNKCDSIKIPTKKHKKSEFRQNNKGKTNLVGTTNFGAGVRAKLGLLKGTGKPEPYLYLFDKNKFTKKTAQEWLSKRINNSQPTDFKLFKEDKEQGLFIKTCVLPCSNDEEQYPDCRDQIYTSDEIAVLLSTEANNCYFDFNHDNKELDGIVTVQNYQSKTEETIDDTKVPIGSWIKIIFSQNSFLNNKIANGEVRGVSNDFTIDTDKNYCKCNKDLPSGINSVLYEDVPEKECIVQTFLSFVDYPCNYMPIEAYDYEEYKLNNGDEAMKLKDALKIFNKKEDGKKKEYTIENAEDVVNIVNEITADQISKFQEDITKLFEAVGADIEQLSTDLAAVQDSISTVLGDKSGDGSSGDGSSKGGDGSGDGSNVQNNDDGDGDGDGGSSDDDISAKLDKIMNKVDDLEKKVEKVKKQPTVKNQNLLKNIQNKQGVKTFLNRGE